MSQSSIDMLLGGGLFLLGYVVGYLLAMRGCHDGRAENPGNFDGPYQKAFPPSRDGDSIELGDKSAYRRWMPYAPGATVHSDQGGPWARIERQIESTPCGCGGKISVNNSVMLCDKCGYGAHVKIEIDE